MKYDIFRKKFKKFPVLDTSTIMRLTRENPQVMRNQIARWVRNGSLIQLKRGLYVFSEGDREREVSKLFIANKIYEPSYISMETALSLYGIIPEGVSVITSITAKGTKRFENAEGHFVYQHVKHDAFRGFRQREFGGLPVFIADPEKAVLDFLYLNSSLFGKNPEDQLRKSYRFQSGVVMNAQRMQEWAKNFDSHKLCRLAEAACHVFGEG